LSSFTWKRLLWLTTCAMFVACASAPAPTPTKKKRKKRSKDRVALKKKKDVEKRDDDDKPDKPATPDRNKAKEEKADEDTVIVSDESDEESAGKKKKKKAKDEETEETAVKKKKKAKDEEDGEGVAAKAKKKKDEAKRKKKEAEEEEARKKKEAEEEELARKEAEKEEARKKKEAEEEEAAARAKKKKKKKDDETKVAAKAKEEEEPADEEPVAEDEEPKRKSKKKPVTVAAKAKKNADIDMSSDEAVIDMEDTSSGSSLDSRVEDQPPERRAVAIAVPGVDDDSDAGEVAADTTPIGTNPLVINERPLVLPKGKLSAHGGLRVGALTLPNGAGGTTSTTSTGLALGVNYGASDSAEVGLDYTAGLSPGSAKGPVALHGAYNAINGKLDLAVAAAFAIDFSGSTDPVTMQTTTKTSFALAIGAWARYRLSRKASVFTGVPALPNSTVSLTKLAFPLPPLPYQLAIGLNNTGTVALDLPVGVGYQATPKIYAFGLLDLAHIRIANTENAFLFKDFIPLSLGGFYALDKLDIGVLFSDDLKQGTDYLRFDTVVRYSIK